VFFEDGNMGGRLRWGEFGKTGSKESRNVDKIEKKTMKKKALVWGLWLWGEKRLY